MHQKTSSILPTECRDFMTKSYWEKFFKKMKKEGGESEYFEWYGDYASFDHLFGKHITCGDQVLHIGCGKSLLAEQLYDEGVCRDILNVDFEPKSLE
jgi:2-polyprenyl-3-methyl-5-hydroxy-6-metoxy-1,4-benzoquinol methylase